MPTRGALLEADAVTKAYKTPSGSLIAVDGVDLGLGRGETLALVGESGCGKSTLARILAGLVSATGGSVKLDGTELAGAVAGRGRRRVQMVFQHPLQSLNPRMRVETSVAEPLVVMGLAPKPRAREQVGEALRRVGLDDRLRHRRPRELSGGQQQRVAIARALICEPEVVVLDEPTASLDAPVQRRIVERLRGIQVEHGVSYVFISHDLRVVSAIADRVAVMYLGRIVELGDTAAVLQNPQHPYTQALLAALPTMNPRERGQLRTLEGEVPDPLHRPTGCAFRSRCAWAIDRCATERPELEPPGGARQTACHVVAGDDGPHSSG